MIRNGFRCRIKGGSQVQWGCGGITRCLDVSASQKMVAVVDDANELHVYELATRKVLWTAEGATSAAWNTQFNDMLCYSGSGLLCSKTADFAVQRQKFQVMGEFLLLQKFACKLSKNVCSAVHTHIDVTYKRSHGKFM